MNTASVRVAVVQAAPVFFDRDATVAKISELTVEAAKNDARLILFPEAFIPAYPRGLSFGAVVGSRTSAGRRLWARYWANSVPVPGPTTEALGEIARRARAYLAVGVIEQEGEFGRGTLYCTMLYFGPDGALLGKHRKLMPTAAERVIWGQGDGSTLTVLDTEIGRIGGLICWENYMPLARMALYAKGVQIYLAPTADARETWQGTLRHIACEGRCFVLGCNQFVAKSHLPTSLDGARGIGEHARDPVPRRSRDHLAPGRCHRRAVVRPGRHRLRRSRSRAGDRGQVRPRRDRTLRTARCIPPGRG